MPTEETISARDFIREAVEEHNRTGRFGGRVCTRFPPEPNGYLHIGHAKAIAIDFGIARDYGGQCNLRFDDTNPVKEETEFVDAIMESIRWLGLDWEDRLFFASDYFQQLYAWAQDLIRKGKAYVCDLTAEQVREYRGTLTEPGKNSPWRDRPVAESLDLFERMKNGEFPDGARTLRAKIDMAHPNFNMRDPVMYRILHAEHHRTGNQPGASTRCTTGRTGRAIPSRGSRTPSATWAMRSTGRCTSGSSTSWGSTARSRSSSRSSRSRTP